MDSTRSTRCTVIGLLSILEAVYIVYMMNYFTSHYEFNYFGLGTIVSNFLSQNKFTNHGSSFPDFKEQSQGRRICELGSWIGWLAGAFLVIRGLVILVLQSYPTAWKMRSKIFLIIGFVMGFLMNWNVLAYLVPILLIEILSMRLSCPPSAVVPPPTLPVPLPVSVSSVSSGTAMPVYSSS
jgi:hypothetical protein